MLAPYRTVTPVNLRHDPLNEVTGVVPAGYAAYAFDKVTIGNVEWLEVATCTRDGTWRHGWMARRIADIALMEAVFFGPVGCPIQDLAPVTQLWGENPAKYAHLGLLGHNGIDMGVVSGTPVHAAFPGLVIRCEMDKGGYGLFVKINHPWGQTISAHLSQSNVGVGQRVEHGQQIGLSGNTGWSSGPHLHFETRLNDIAFDPLLTMDLGQLRLPGYMPRALYDLLEERR